jgi:uncharacterized MnhB-related membrane protein
MSDLTLQNIQAKLPAGAIVLDGANDDVRVSLKALMGESAVALTDAKVGEFVSKLLDACAAAQVDYNAAPGPDIRSYPTPTASTPIRNATTGQYSSNFTYSVSVAVPLNRDEVMALQV